MSGGWLTENKTSEIVSQLYNNAAAIAAVRQGVVQEAYAQVERCSLFTYFLDKSAIKMRLTFESRRTVNIVKTSRKLSCVRKQHKTAHFQV